jgi:O-antigen/teichoic acid export membrane protein
MRKLPVAIARLLDAARTQRTLLGSSAWGLLDQALISAMNFGTTVLLARGLGPAAFGAFSVAYLILLLANSLQTSLVTQPHNVLGAPLRGSAYADYTTSSAAGQAALAGALTLLVLLATAVPALAQAPGRSVVLALAAAVPAWQLQEFARRVLYTKARIRAAFVNDLASYGGQIVALGLLLWDHRLTPATALYAIAASSAAAAALGFWAIRRELRGRLDLAALRESWGMGKWLSAATVTNWLASQMYPVLTAGLVGAAATGLLRALQNLIAPTQILANTYQMVVTPQAAMEEVRGGGRAVASFLASTSVLLAVPLLIYFLVVGLFARPLVTLFYSSAYSAAATIVWPLGLAYLLSYAGRVLSIGLAAVQDTRPVFYAQLAAAATTFSVGLLLIRGYGLAGAAVGAAITQAVLAASLGWSFRRRCLGTVHRSPAGPTRPERPPVVGT